MDKTPKLGAQLVAVSGTIALIVYLLAGWFFGAWAWAWIVFLVPGLIVRWQSAGRGESSGTATPPASHEGSEPAKDVPPPQRYEG